MHTRHYVKVRIGTYEQHCVRARAREEAWSSLPFPQFKWQQLSTQRTRSWSRVACSAISEPRGRTLMLHTCTMPLKADGAAGGFWDHRQEVVLEVVVRAIVGAVLAAAGFPVVVCALLETTVAVVVRTGPLSTIGTAVVPAKVKALIIAAACVSIVVEAVSAAVVPAVLAVVITPVAPVLPSVVESVVTALVSLLIVLATVVVEYVFVAVVATVFLA
ncbi:hypothetical protein NDU88_001907 [Pleurodeles waltl]|uniref:Uncharacterized protein n=1 Tax=Pleurodeles waltl TaxID=8319 RepID=A0AAV7U871_PLEWA|nr:hypothetical protein NDU88_001907 [Pleurodeles waltl]